MSKLWLAALCVLVNCLTVAPNIQAAENTPNIVLILADDLGWGDVTCNNPQSLIATPNIDRIADEGMRFTRAHSPSAVCAPTRYGLLTGRFAWRTWMREGVLYTYCDPLIPPERMTMASMLKKNGYRTGVFGKWHLGLKWTPVAGDHGDWSEGTLTRSDWRSITSRVDFTMPVEGGPLALGFDRFYGIVDNPSTTCYMENDRVVNPEIRNNRPYTPGYDRKIIDDVFVEQTIDFMEQCRNETPDSPFFAYIPLTAAHAPLDPPDRLRGKSPDGLRGDMCLWVDESVGKIYAALERMNILDNTLLIFTSDNGPIFNGTRQTWEKTSEHQPAGAYRGYKTDIWEGGTHIPFVARWPGHVPQAVVSEQLFCLTDIMATLAALVDEPLHDWVAEDSFNMLPAILGNTERDDLRESLITHSYFGNFAVRQGPWKLILDTHGSGGHYSATPYWQPTVTSPFEEPGTSGVGQLYNLANDPYEQHNLYEEQPDIVKRLAQLFVNQRKNGRSRPITE
jgi:arylsulfatase A